MKRNRMLKVWLICAFALGFVVAVDYDAEEDFLRHEDNTTVQEVQSPDLLEASTTNIDNYNESEKDNAFCTAPPDIDGAISPILDRAVHPVGTIISYHCPFGHVSRSSSSLISVCRIDKYSGKAEWTRPNIACIPRSCGDPGYVANGRRIGNLFTFPNKVEFECLEGYRLRGLKDRYCQAGGDWSGRLPVCDPIFCAVPSNPVNGRVFYSSLEYGTALQYECNKGFKLQNDQPRICSKDGTWSNNQPECIEIKCGIPEAPEQGTVLLSTDEPKVGTLALYSCNEGLILTGASTSKCLKSGNWTFDPPKCLSSCSVYDIEGGEFGQYKTRRYRYRTVEEFVAFQIGEPIKHGDVVIVRCKNGFLLENKDTGDSTEISCNSGMWSESPQCSPKSCTEDPPPIENGYAVGKNLQHGEVTWYKCYRGYDKTKSGKVVCTYGKWEGPRPVCSDTRCYMNQLNFPGLSIPQRVHARNGSTFEFHCEEGYTLASRENTISCFQGKWNINENPCRIMTCEDDPPSLQNGKFRYFYRQHNSQVNYECDDDYELVGHSSVQCLYGEWKGQLPSCEPYENNLEASSTIKWESTNPTSESGTQNIRKQPDEECFCSYDYRTDLMEASVENRKLRANESVKIGEKVLFECYGNMNIAWPNGLRFYRTMELTCDACQHWQMNDLPVCETADSGQSYINYTPEIKILPRGIIEVPKSKRITLMCINPWVQPTWNTGDRGGINVYAQSRDAVEQVFKNYMIINEMDYEHAGKYECFAVDSYGRTYSATKVDLKITEVGVTCPELSTDTNQGSFNIVYENERKVNSEAQYSCKDSSHKLIGKRRRKCLQNGKWSGSYPTCEGDIRCPFLDESNIFMINYSNHRKMRSTAFYYCKNNKQKMTGSSNRTCLHTGQWSGIAPVCEDITCPDFRTYNGLLVTYTDGTKVQSVATFSCLDHWILVGNSTSVCQYSGMWNSSKPSCELLEIRCPKIDGKDIFTIKYTSDRRINSTAQFFCKADGQKVSGCNFMTCQPNGEWSGDYPTCVDYVTCERFVAPPNLKISYSKEQRVESIASFECLYSTPMSGSSWATCRPDGTWSHSLPSCEDPKCSMDVLMQRLPENVIPDMLQVTSEDVPPGLELELLCEQGLIPTENSKAICNSHGQWDIGNAQCISGCRLITDAPSNLIIEPMKNYYRFGEFILLSCPYGQKLTSEVERLMCMGKSWSDTMPNCTEWKDTTASDFRKTTRMISRS